MKILALTPYLPAPPDFGGASRIYNLLRHFQERASLTVFSLATSDDEPGPSMEAFERLIMSRAPLTARSPASPRKRQMQIRSALSRRSFQYHFYWYRNAQRRLNQVLQQEMYDIVQIEFSQMAAYATPGTRYRVLDLHNIEHDVLRQAAGGGAIPKRLFNSLEWRKFRSEEESYWHRADLCLTTSPGDAAAVRRVTGEECLVVPNGVDAHLYERAPLDEATPGSIVFTGAMRYQPNADAASFFVRRVWPRIREMEPQARFTIVGADPPDEVLGLSHHAGVSVTGSVEDIRPYLRSASAVVVPLLTGGGTRLKVLEAFATGRPVISTSVGVSGLDVVDDDHLLIADRPEEFARKVVAVLRDRSLAGRLTDRAYSVMQEKYQWQSIGDALLSRYEAMLGREDGRLSMPRTPSSQWKL